jgi:murein DD-endopeptidase MepM/ murein hydrolase activator NlpD
MRSSLRQLVRRFAFGVAALSIPALALGASPGPSEAAATAAITLNKTEFKAGDALTVGIQVANPSDSPAANLFLGVVTPDGQNALFVVPSGATPPVSLTDPANFRSLQPAPPGFTLSVPAFAQFTWPADGLPIGTYLLFVALTHANTGAVLALDVKPFTYSPRNTFLPMFRKPFDGEFRLSNWFDHNLPFEFVDTNGIRVNFAGELWNGIDGHNGYDFPMPEGTPILAVADGSVVVAGAGSPNPCPILNNQIVVVQSVTVRHTAPNGQSIDSGYLHLSRVDVQVGQHVVAGQQIGLSGNTGCSTGPHLHFEAYRLSGTNSGQRTRIDPFGWDSAQPDPWAQDGRGAQSFYLWLPGQAPALRFSRSLEPNCGTTPPLCGSAAVAITLVSSMGVRDDLDVNNEFVELTLDTRFNSGNTSRPLTGYTLRNNAGDVYSFPAGLAIRDGHPVRVYSGFGVNGAATLYWGRTGRVWNNLGDCAQLVSPTGGRYIVSVNGGSC